MIRTIERMVIIRFKKARAGCMLVTTAMNALMRPPRMFAYIAADAGHPSVLTCHGSVR